MKKIPPFHLKLEPLTEESANLPKFKWAAEEIGNRSQIGGEPNFIQAEHWPICSGCAQKMTFYAQLDSINDEFVIADCGMIYVFVCFDCNSVESRIHSH